MRRNKGNVAWENERWKISTDITIIINRLRKTGNVVSKKEMGEEKLGDSYSINRI